MKKIIALITDSYKYSHFEQYPPGTQHVTSYVESRGYDKELFRDVPEVVALGVEWFIEDYMLEPLTHEDIDLAKILITAHGEPFNETGWRRIVDVHKGLLPVVIEALPEGTVTTSGVPLVQITNTDPELPWVTSFIETALLRAVWYPTTVATVSRECKKIINHFLDVTGDPSLIDFKLHDFGARGATSHESAAIGGAAHLVNFKGTDTFEAIVYLYVKYGEVFGFSIPASEHSTITSWGRDGEALAFKNMLDKFGSGLVACVSDSYDIFAACADLWGDKLKDDVLAISGGLVVRPDSGDPVTVTLRVIEILGEKFGYTTNEKGYKVLNPKVRIIQGDGVHLKSINDILYAFMLNGWSADNIAFGMGGALLQRVDRNSLNFAMKANEVVIDGIARPVFKDPITDHGKSSKKGKQGVFKNAFGGLEAWPLADVSVDMVKDNLLTVKYKDGESPSFSSFSAIRERTKI